MTDAVEYVLSPEKIKELRKGIEQGFNKLWDKVHRLLDPNARINKLFALAKGNKGNQKFN